MRLVIGIVLGIIAWFAVALGIALAIKQGAPALSAALAAHATTIAMAERLAISFIASLFCGYFAALGSGERSQAPLLAGIVLLAGWGYYHVTKIWHDFPLWYHLTFFVSLVLISVIGGRLKRA
jgi:hypothetical protein